jgi:prophage DNA circulation protein
MAWRDQLHSASFRGAPFEVTTGTINVGRRVAAHEYPQRDQPWLEDMGRRKREYKIEAYVIGPDYMAARDRLLAAVEQPGGGQLVHPYYGTKIVTVTECESSETTELGGMARITLTCVEAGEQALPTAGIDSARQLTTAQDNAFDSVSDDFSSSFSVARLPSWGVDNITSTFNSFTSLSSFTSAASAVSDFQSGLGDLIALPGSLASRVIDMVRSLTSVGDILNQPFVKRTSGSLLQTSTRARVQQQQSAVSVLIKRAALIQHAGLLTNTSLDTSDAVQTARAALLREFDANDYAVDIARPSSAVSAQLKTLRSAALVHLARQSVTLPKTYSLRLLEPQPALALSYALYGDLREADIVRRNAVRHPGFVPAGQTLQLTTI